MDNCSTVDHKRQAARTTFTTSRLSEFCSAKELTAQTGHDPENWPLLIVKELVDNALDACEEAGTAPKIAIKVAADEITVADNGPGLPVETLDGVLDYGVRVSSREAYVAPDRGAQGNALKTILAMPFAANGERGLVELLSRGQRHRITFEIDQVERRPVVRRESRTARNVRTGSSVRVFWASSIEDLEVEFLHLARSFAFLNPHLSLIVNLFDKRHTFEATEANWRKWTPSEPICASWYDTASFERLAAAHIAHDRQRAEDRHVRDFLATFRGLTGSGKQKAVLDATGLSRTKLSALANGSGLRRDVLKTLLEMMQAATTAVKPAALGIIGRQHLAERFQEIGSDSDTFKYRRILGHDDDGLPYVVEVAFAWRPAEGRRLVTGVNWSGSVGESPFRDLGDYGLDGLLADRRAEWDEPVAVFVHLATPRARYTDRGKSAVVVDDAKATAIVTAVETVTRAWTKQRRAEERSERRRVNRHDALRRLKRVSIKDAAWEVLPDAYQHASGGGSLPVKARQLYYAARGRILELTGRETLDQCYFSQTVVRDFMEAHQEETANWDVVFDSRGNYTEPHTRRVVPLGTLEVRRFLEKVHESREPVYDFRISTDFPTIGPKHRFSALLFIEKEGFNELFRAVHLAERYDIAIMSTKGLSVAACRQLADELCGQHEIPLLVLHDFDKSGFSIAGTLQRDSRVYQFQHDIEVIDVGLRLGDVQACGLDSELVAYGTSKRTRQPTDPGPNLAENGATEEEIEFLRGERTHEGYQGRRVELNAFSSPGLIAWLEGKLQEHVCKLVPDELTLESAYRRAFRVVTVNSRLPDLMSEAGEAADAATVPRNLGGAIRRRLKATPALPWDAAIAALAEDAVVKNGQSRHRR